MIHTSLSKEVYLSNGVKTGSKLDIVLGGPDTLHLCLSPGDECEMREFSLPSIRVILIAGAGETSQSNELLVCYTSTYSSSSSCWGWSSFHQKATVAL